MTQARQIILTMVSGIAHKIYSTIKMKQLNFIYLLFCT